jgi:hypothetical protein
MVTEAINIRLTVDSTEARIYCKRLDYDGRIIEDYLGSLVTIGLLTK